MNLSRLKAIHVFGNKERTLMFRPDTFFLGSLSEQPGTIVRELKAGRSYADIAAMVGLSVAEVEAFSEQLLASSFINQSMDIASVQDDSAPTLYLNLTSDCNLRCVYCYANFGAYAGSKGGMSLATAQQSVDRFVSQYGRLGAVTFFGGEPLIAFDLIQQTIEYIEHKTQDRSELPHYSMVSNGVLINASIAKYLADKKMGVTLSIDGPKAIHDALRPNVAGKGSFEKVDEGLKLLLKHGVRANVEGTYTPLHIDAKLSPRDILHFFREEYGIKSLTLSPATSVPGREMGVKEYYDYLIPAYREAAQYSMETLLSEKPIVLFQVSQVLSQYFRRQKKPAHQFCYTRLGEKLFAVSTGGDVYPCHMLNGQDGCNMGNIGDEEMFSSQSFHDTQNMFKSLSKDEMQCHKCWARELCFICTAGVKIETDKFKPIPRYRCELIMGVIETVLEFIDEHSGQEKQIATALYGR